MIAARESLSIARRFVLATAVALALVQTSPRHALHIFAVEHVVARCQVAEPGTVPYRTSTAPTTVTSAPSSFPARCSRSRRSTMARMTETIVVMPSSGSICAAFRPIR